MQQELLEFLRAGDYSNDTAFRSAEIAARFEDWCKANKPEVVPYITATAVGKGLTAIYESKAFPALTRRKVGCAFRWAVLS